MSSNYTENNIYKGVFVSYTRNESSIETMYKEEISRTVMNGDIALKANKCLLRARTKTMIVTIKKRRDELQIEISQPVNLLKFSKLAIMPKMYQEHTEGHRDEIETGEASGSQSAGGQATRGETLGGQDNESVVYEGQATGGDTTQDETIEGTHVGGEAAKNIKATGEAASGGEEAEGQDPMGNNNNNTDSSTSNNDDNKNGDDVIHNVKEKITTSTVRKEFLEYLRHVDGNSKSIKYILRAFVNTITITTNETIEEVRIR